MFRPILILTFLPSLLGAAATREPLAPPDLVLAEQNGILAIEAEHFFKQTRTEKRAWYITSGDAVPQVQPDGDPPHAEGASGGACVELLPDTRRSHDDRLIKDENFTNTGGIMAVLSYRAQFTTPGRYYVWVRAWSTTTEDNGLHFGLDGQWPESGARWQTVKKNGWHWDCKQRTEAVHTGVPMQLWLDIPSAGPHEILMSMREDGIEVDKLVLARDPDWKTQGPGPEPVAAAGSLPPPFAATPAAEADTAPAVTAENPADSGPDLMLPRGADGTGSVTTGTSELKLWHNITLTLDGPFAHEQDRKPNPFTDCRFEVTFTHSARESGLTVYRVPGYFAADGKAAETSAESGNQWRVHFVPNQTGVWNWRVSFTRGTGAALDRHAAAEKVTPFDGVSGFFTILPSDKTGRDFRGQGRLEWTGRRYLQFAGSEEFFLKAGADAPETLLGYADFDNTVAGKPDKVPLKTWQPHVRDWREGDPSWQGGKGKGLIGALNYLAGKGVNAFSFLTYNAGGDGDNVWPFISRNDKLHYDCSKLDQWGIVFNHATAQGLYLHFKLQENEMDDDRVGHESKPGRVPESLDGGRLGPERKLYCRELIARFGHALALNWNIGEESTQSTEEISDMLRYLAETDQWQHLRVLHTFPDQQDQKYPPLLGKASELTGLSLQNSWDTSHQRALTWIRQSEEAGKPWVVAQDEQNPAGLGVPPDIGYKGSDGLAVERRKRTENATTGDVKSRAYTMHDIRKLTLWGNLMAGGAGVEYYFGYSLPENDLVCEDFRSRDRSWDYCRYALEFFRDQKIPFAEMENADALVGNPRGDNSRYCLAKTGEGYLIYLPDGGTTSLDLSGVSGRFRVEWFNPRAGGALSAGSVREVAGGAMAALGDSPADPAEDWLILVRK